MVQGKEGLIVPSGGVNNSDRISIWVAQDDSLGPASRPRPAANLEGRWHNGFDHSSVRFPCP